MKYPDNFLGLEERDSKSYRESKAVVLPVPFEGTVSYGSGASKAPAAILEASKYIELFDEELGKEFHTIGVWTEEELRAEESPEKMLEIVYNAAKRHASEGKFLVMLGGEHSISFGAVRAFKEKCPTLSVLQLDAHADMREHYSGTRFSHAAVMSRISEICQAVQVGVRSLSLAEAEKAEKNNCNIFFAKDIHDNEKWIEKAISKLTNDVYITFDVDVFDSSLMPATGYPEPGGLNWYLVLKFLKEVFRRKNVVGFDLMELAPIERMHAPNFVAAKLAYKAIGYKFFLGNAQKPAEQQALKTPAHKIQIC